MLQIFVNGEPAQVTATSVAQWVADAGLVANAVSTAVNGEFVARDARAGQALREGDRLDVFRAIVGG